MKEKNHYLYFIKCNEFVKIGHTNNVRRRMIDIKGGNPYPLELIAVIVYDSKSKATTDEKRLHKTYEEKRESGEWFKNLDLELEWPKIHALTYGSVDYKKYIPLDEYGDIVGNVFNDTPDGIPSKPIPDQTRPKTPGRAPRDSTEILYHIFFQHPETRQGRRSTVNNYLDFPVSDKTITVARRNFKQYATGSVSKLIMKVALYIYRNNATTKSAKTQFNISWEIAKKAKEISTIYKVHQNYV